MEATKKDLGGGNSNIFYVHPEPWGFMLQFDDTIFFRWVGSNQPPTKKDPCSVVFIAPFFLVPQKNRTFGERGKFGPPHTSVENFNWTGGTLEKTLGGNPTGGGGVLRGVFWKLLLVAMEWPFLFKLALENSGLIRAGRNCCDVRSILVSPC